MSIIHQARVVPGLIEQVNPGQSISKPEKAAGEEKFTDLIKNLVNSVNEVQGEAAQSQQAFLAGEPVELHDVMIKAEKAGISMSLLIEIRNRLLTAYQEISRMPM